MSNFLYDTIFTNYASSKLANKLAGSASPLNLIVIKIGDGDNTLSVNKSSLSSAMYTLNVTDAVVSDNSVIFTAEIPEAIKGIKITEIGLFDVSDGRERLFSYSKVDAVKPEDLGYQLVVELNLTLRTVNFNPELLHVQVTESESATKRDYSALEDTFLYIETNLERIIDYNTTEIGKFLPQVIYKNEQALSEILKGSSFASRYFNILNMFGSQVKDCYFISDENFLYYSINDMANSNAYVDIYSNQIKTYGDFINFSGQNTLAFTVKLGKNEINVPIINKISDDEIQDPYFTFNLINGEYLEFKLYGDEIYSFKCYLSIQELINIQENYNTYTIVLNSMGAPSANFYINDELMTIDETSARMEVPDNSGYPLRNFVIDDGITKIGQNLAIKNIVYLSRLISDLDVHVLNTILSA